MFQGSYLIFHQWTQNIQTTKMLIRDFHLKIKKKRMNELEFKTSRYIYVMDISNKLIDLDPKKYDCSTNRLHQWNNQWLKYNLDR